jgi:hypothetical protein
LPGAARLPASPKLGHGEQQDQDRVWSVDDEREVGEQAGKPKPGVERRRDPAAVV